MARRFNKLFLWAAWFAMFCLLTVSCGTQGGGAEKSGDSGGESPGEGEPAEAYTVSCHEIDSFGNGSVRNIQVNGRFIFYTVRENRDGQSYHRFYRQDIKGGGSAQELYAEAEARQRTGLCAFFADAMGYGYVILQSREEDGPGEQYFLCKYGIRGVELFRQEITGQMAAETGEPNLLRGLAVDGEGRICICLSRAVWLYDEEGNLLSQVRLPQDTADVDCGGDGRIYVTCRTGTGTTLNVVDFEKKELQELCNNFPGDGNLSAGVKYDLVAKDREKLYGYTAGMESPQVLLWWKDCDLHGDDVDYVCGLEEGRFLAVTREAGGNQIAMLSPAGLEGIPEKEIITIGLLELQSGQELERLIANFNRSSEHYRAELVVYGEGSTSIDEVTEALDEANLAIISGKSPDLIVIGRNAVMVNLYVQKGILEDLNGYLDQSEALDREMFIEPALNMFAYGDGLYGIPLSVEIKTIVGRSSQVGTDMGWTLEDMERLWREHPDSQLFRLSSTKNEILCTYLEYTYNLEEFVDWEKGSCSFDSEEFKSLLEFANHFPMEAATNVGDEDVLLWDWWIHDLTDLPFLREMLGGEITCVGYPCRTGSGSMFGTCECAFGISALSEHKEGAWEFIEYMLSDETNADLGYNFPIRKDWLERRLMHGLGKGYIYDGEGNILRDENGRPQTVQAVEMFGLAPTVEDAELVIELLETAETTHGSWGKLFNIITEEAAPYFYGQKTLEQVVDIIQRRAQIYVSENM